MKQILRYSTAFGIFLLVNWSFAAVDVLFVVGNQVDQGKLQGYLNECPKESTRFSGDLVPFFDGRLYKITFNNYTVAPTREKNVWQDNTANRQIFENAIRSLWNCLNSKGRIKNGDPNLIWSISENVRRQILPHYEVGPDRNYRSLSADGLTEVYPEPAKPNKFGSKPVTVAVLDTAESASTDSYTHGLPIGKIIEQITYSYKKYITVIYIKVCDTVCNDDAIIRVVQDLTKKFAGKGLVLNLSFGSTIDNSLGLNEPAIAKALREAIRRGVLIAAAAGNMDLRDDMNCGNTSRPEISCYENRVKTGDTYITDRVYPAAYASGLPGIFAVGSLQKLAAASNGYLYQRAPSSWLATWITLSAPGRGIKVQSRVYQGTSFATPFVTATLALLRTKYEPAEVIEKIKQCIHMPPDIQPEKLNATGWGRIDYNCGQ